MAREMKTALRASAPDELLVPALVVGSAALRARRSSARARRIPGLSLLFVGPARSLVRVAPPRVPALPWSAGLSPALLWGHAARGDRGERAPSGPRALSEQPPRGATDRARSEIGTVKEAREGTRPEPGGAGLEAIAPALVLVRSSLGAPHREARAAGSSALAPSAATRGPAPATAPAPDAAASRGAAHRRAHGGWGFALELAAARPASARVEPTVSPTPAPRADAPLPALRIERTEASALGAAREGRAREEQGARMSPVSASPDVLPWGASSSARSVHPALADAAAATEPSAPLLLPLRDRRAAPAAMVTSVVEVAESLRTFVTREVQEVKDAVDRVARRKPPEAHEPPASLAPSDDTVRRLMSRMRTMMQEERFRSGKLR